MKNQKIIITLPETLVTKIDEMSKARDIPRNRLIRRMLSEKVREENRRHLKEAYDTVFAGESIRREQLEMSRWLAQGDNQEGQEW
jgi:metal-responsive CopG/Arc/MetJ family transcriptional regulator